MPSKVYGTIQPMFTTAYIMAELNIYLIAVLSCPLEYFA